MANEAKVFMTAQVLPDSIKKQFTNCNVSITPATANEKWYYKDTIVASGSSVNLIKGVFIGLNAGTPVGDAQATIANGDKVRFIFIKHTGTTDGTTSTTESVVICLDGDTAAYNLADGIEIGPGEAFWMKCPNTTVDNLHVATVDSNMNDGGSAGEDDILLRVAALIDDV